MASTRQGQPQSLTGPASFNQIMLMRSWLMLVPRARDVI
jgi:hypothetical protein